MARFRVKPCAADGCEILVAKDGTFCNMHYHRAKRGGDMTKPPRMRNDGPCSVEGCAVPSKALGLCDTHYAAFRRNGDPTVRLVAPKGSGSANGNGYRKVYVPGHPIAKGDGTCLEHRVVLHGVIGAGEHPCHWCGRLVTWDERSVSNPRTLVVDHLNHVRDDNRSENLVPSCVACNAARNPRSSSKSGKAHV